MRRGMAVLLVLSGATTWLDCSGDSSQPDASMDVTTPDVSEVDAYEASADVSIDVPPEQAIWVATATTLFKFDPIAKTVTRIADFDCSGEAMVDLAMNANEELFGVTTESVVRIDKMTGACTIVAQGASNLPYATSFVPASALDSGVEGWFGYKYTVYSSIDPDSGAESFVGTLGNQFGQPQASGDMVTIPGGKTYLTSFSANPMTGDIILEVDPNTGAVTNFNIQTGVSALVGMAQWAGSLYIFSQAGAIYRGTPIGDAGTIDLQNIGVTYDFGDAGLSDATDSDAADAADAAVETGPFIPSWRGAAVTTRAPGPP